VPYERVADNVYFFQSDQYAQVTAGVIAGPEFAVVIDTLAFPEETIEMRDFVEHELGLPVRYMINTHYHADHTWGNAFFPGALVLSHKLCHQLLKERGIPSLQAAKAQNPTFRDIDIVLPHLTFDDGELGIQVGKKTIRTISLPGHSPDGIGVFIEEDRVLFTGDLIMPVPYIVDGNIDDMIASLDKVEKMTLENIVEGHGDIILRGEIHRSIKNNLDYLEDIQKIVRKASRRKFPLDLLEVEDVEDAGKSRVLLGGLAPELHRRNLIALYQQTFGELPAGSEEYYDD